MERSDSPPLAHLSPSLPPRETACAFLTPDGLPEPGEASRRDPSSHDWTRALIEGQNRVLEKVATGASLSESLDLLLRVVEDRAPGVLGSILLLDPDGLHLRHGAAPSLPAEYVAAIDGITIGPEVGSCGTAAHSKANVFCPDIDTHPFWRNFKGLALQHGLRGCWSMPIFDAQQSVLGTFAVYYRQPSPPDPNHRRLVDMATHTASIAIEKHRTEEELRRYRDHLEDLVMVRTRELSDSNKQLKIARDLAEAANQAKSRFLANMSHELRTPLNGILGFSQILQRDQALDEKQKAGVQAIRGCGERLLELVSDILEVSGSETSTPKLYPTRIDLHEFLGAVETAARAGKESGPLAFSVEVAPDLPRSILVDPAPLRRVLHNLLGNAFKYTVEGGVTLRVLAAPSPLQGEVSGQPSIRFEIQDTGIGIPPDQLEGVFAPFDRVEDSVTVGGAGLGLTISRRLVRLMGGDIHVRSHLGQGSTFWFDLILPVAPPSVDPENG